MTYHYEIKWNEEAEEYIGFCNEIPLLSHHADSPEDALRGIQKLTDTYAHDLFILTAHIQTFGHTQ